VTGIVPALLRGEPAPTYELALRAKDGARVEMLFNSTARRDAAGAVVGLLSVGQVCHARVPPPHVPLTLSLTLSLSRSPFLRLFLSVTPRLDRRQILGDPADGRSGAFALQAADARVFARLKVADPKIMDSKKGTDSKIMVRCSKQRTRRCPRLRATESNGPEDAVEPAVGSCI
jgi:hypothetical protein